MVLITLSSDKDNSENFEVYCNVPINLSDGDYNEKSKFTFLKISFSEIYFKNLYF
jgi:hypothetical protein